VQKRKKDNKINKRLMEWCAGALGNRSILTDPRHEEMQNIVNRKIKFRKGFRPFAPSIHGDRASEFLEIEHESPYMLFVHDVVDGEKNEIPAVTHVDGTARMQTVRQSDNPTYYGLIEKFSERTGVPVVLNTSMNRRGEPIVNTPENAVAVFENKNMDYMCFPDADILIEEV
jgi:carbamoyltransferase